MHDAIVIVAFQFIWELRSSPSSEVSGNRHVKEDGWKRFGGDVCGDGDDDGDVSMPDRLSLSSALGRHSRHETGL